MGDVNNITRKKDVGAPGPGGQFASPTQSNPEDELGAWATTPIDWLGGYTPENLDVDIYLDGTVPKEQWRWRVAVYGVDAEGNTLASGDPLLAFDAEVPAAMAAEAEQGAAQDEHYEWTGDWQSLSSADEWLRDAILAQAPRD